MSCESCWLKRERSRRMKTQRMRRGSWVIASRVIALVALSQVLLTIALAQSGTTTKDPPHSGSRAPRLAAPDAAKADFPPELVNWTPRPDNPIFTSEGRCHWDVKIRERGWILR